MVSGIMLGQRQAQVGLAGLAFNDEEVEQLAGGHEAVGIAELGLDRLPHRPSGSPVRCGPTNVL